MQIRKKGGWNLKKIFSSQDGADGHNFEMGSPKDHFSKVWLRLAQ
jgi:hypothetical protein